MGSIDDGIPSPKRRTLKSTFLNEENSIFKSNPFEMNSSVFNGRINSIRMTNKSYEENLKNSKNYFQDEVVMSPNLKKSLKNRAIIEDNSSRLFKLQSTFK